MSVLRGSIESKILGKPIDEAREVAQAAGATVREVKCDGVELTKSWELNPQRLNVATEGGKVVSVESIG